MLKRIIIILLLIPILTMTAPSKVESYSVENVIPQEALKASGATFNEIKIVLWTKYENKQEALKLKEKWQGLLTHKDANFTGKIIIQPKTHYIIADLISTQFSPKSIISKSQYRSIIYIGSFEGPIDKITGEKIISKIMKLTDAKQIDYYEDKQSCFWSGYTNLIKDDVVADGKKINLNIALRYNAIENKTYIFIGTPIITMEY